MDPTRLIPSPDSLPAPWGLFQVLLVATFVLHLVMANIMIGTGFAALWAHFWPGGSGRAVSREAARRLPLTIALTVNLGVAPLLFLQVLYGHFFYVSTVLMAAYWVSIFVVILLAYYGAYLFHYKYDELGTGRVWLAGFSVVLLLAVGFFFSNSLALMMDPKAWLEYFRRPGGTIIHWKEPALVPGFLHFAISSVAVGGLCMGLFGWWRKRLGDTTGEDPMRRGLILYGCATVVQFVVGAWYLGALPNAVLARAAFESRVVFPLFLVSVMTGLASILFSFGEKPWHTAVSFLLTVVLMVLFRSSVRTGYLEPYLSVQRPEVVLQLGPLVLFVLTLIVGFSVVAYTLRLALRAGKEARP
jgi:hypothetical protein